MLRLLTRFAFTLKLLTLLTVACAAPPEVRLTPRDEYEKIPTRQQMERAKALKSAPTRTTPVLQNRSILENVLLDKQPSESLSRSVPQVRQLPLQHSLRSTQSVRPGSADDASTTEAIGTYGHYTGPSKLDLKEFLPPPERQKQQNCVAWALGYASYSCQICQERKSSKPIHDYDLFSPSFIYNKLNHDPRRGTIRDDGLVVTEAIQFILKHGCATAKTMPLFDQALPNSAAESEADVYRAFGHQKAENVSDIRAYLQEGYPVILVIRNSPEFKKNERLKEPYRWERTVEAMQNLEPHAICAVGYNDKKQAILVMNSYGDRWKDCGFCWVHYDSLNTIPSERTDDAEVWCLEAHVIMIKNNNPAVTMSYPFGGGFLLDDGEFFHAPQTFDVSFVLDDDGMVYGGDIRVSPNVSDLPEWHIEDLTCNDETIFVMRKDQLVARLNNDDAVVTARKRSAEWAHLTNGLPTGSKIRMIAAAKKTPLFALTDKGELLQMPANGSHWQRSSVDGAAESVFTDLRDNDSKGPVSLATNDGRVFTFEAGEGWVIRTK